MLSKQHKRELGELYLKYMAILTRQLIRDIKIIKVTCFDPYILSAAIDEGMWAQDPSLEYEMQFSGDYQEYSKDMPLMQPVKYFWQHEVNFVELTECFD